MVGFQDSRFNLHAAVQKCARREVALDVVIALIDSEAVMLPDDKENLPLHYAVIGSFDPNGGDRVPIVLNPELLVHLIRANPASLHGRGADGMDPLTEITRNTSPLSEELMELMFEAVAGEISWAPVCSTDWARYCILRDPGLLNNPGRSLYPPLHEALQYSASSEVVLLLLDANPDAARVVSPQNKTVLHFAPRNKTVLTRLLELVPPDYVATQDDSKRLPLHCACEASKDGDGHEVVELLLAAYPDAIGVVETQDRLPLHCACAGTQPYLPTVRLLLQRFLDAAMRPDCYGNLPLHLAAMCASLEVVVLEALLDAYADAADVRNSAGELPLHCACRTGSRSVAWTLVGVLPDAAREPTAKGEFPLHGALRSKAVSPTLVTRLLQLYPQAARVPDGSGRLPLHIAICSDSMFGVGAPFSVIEELLGQYEEAVWEVDRGSPTRDYCLHAAIKLRGDEALGVVRALVLRFPELLQKKNVFQQVPLFVAAAEGSVEVLQEVLAGLPRAIREVDEFGKLPLHGAAHSGRGRKIMELLLRGAADTAMVKDNDGNLPLHHAARCVFDKTPDTLLSLLEVAPEALSAKNHAHMFPLHVALESRGSAAVIGAILRAAPQIGAVRAEFGCFASPLHLAAERTDSVEIIEMLLKVCPERLQERDVSTRYPLSKAIAKNSKNPAIALALLQAQPDTAQLEPYAAAGVTMLHLAAEYALSASVVDALVAAYPAALRVRGKFQGHGRLPLHDAARSRDSSEEVLAALIQADRGALFEKDDYGLLPLHHALLGERTLAAVLLIVKSGPKAAKALAAVGASEEGSSLPIDLVKMAQSFRPSERVALSVALAERDLPTDEDYAGSWHALVSMDSAQVIDDALRRLCEQNIHEIRALCQRKDREGRPLLSVASKSCREILYDFLLFCGRFDIMDGPALHQSATSMVVEAWDLRLDDEFRAVFQREATAGDEAGDTLNLEGFAAAAVELGLFPPPCDLKEGEAVEYCDAAKIWGPAMVRRVAGRSYDIVQTTVKDPAKAEVKAVRRIRLRNKEERRVAETFAVAAGQRNVMDETSFVDFCRAKLGKSRRVVLKFMRHGGQYERERLFRSRLGGAEGGAVVGALAELDAGRLARDLATLTVNGKRLADYPYCLVMLAADRNLDAIRRAERLEVDQVRAYARQIGECLRQLHLSDVMHGDLKLLNAVRVLERIQLIDLDAAALMPPPPMPSNSTMGDRSVGELHGETEAEGEKETLCRFAGAKFSSGVLPPEMFMELDEAQMRRFEEYFSQAASQDPEWWSKVAPVPSSRRGHWIVVKTFLVDAYNQPVAPEQLPYALLPAARSIDTWAFGVVLFSLLARRPLLMVSDDDDLVNLVGDKRAGAEKVLRGMRRELATQLTPAVIADRHARDLLGKLLDSDPANRLADMDEVLRHAFFDPDAALAQQLRAVAQDVRLVRDVASKTLEEVQRQSLLLGAIHNRTRVLEQLATQSIAQMKRSQEVLLRGMMEAAEADVPSCFLVVNTRLEGPISSSNEEGEGNDEGGAGRVGRVVRWMADVVDMMQSAAEAGPRRVVEGVQALFSGDELYIYLVDELRGEPVLGAPHYPIVISQRSERVARLLPMMRTGMQLIMLANGAAGLARCLGFPTLCLSGDAVQGLRNGLQVLSQKDSLAAFDRLHNLVVSSGAGRRKAKAVASSNSGEANEDIPVADPGEADLQLVKSVGSTDSEQAKKVRGAALREWRRVLEENDPDGTFAGLQRVLAQDGTCVWTTEDGVRQLSAAPSVLDYPLPHFLSSVQVFTVLKAMLVEGAAHYQAWSPQSEKRFAAHMFDAGACAELVAEMAELLGCDPIRLTSQAQGHSQKATVNRKEEVLRALEAALQGADGRVSGEQLLGLLQAEQPQPQGPALQMTLSPEQWATLLYQLQLGEGVAFAAGGTRTVRARKGQVVPDGVQAGGASGCALM